MKEFPKLIGLCGVARSGKDTFCAHAIKLCEEQQVTASRVSFADALKQDVKDFLLNKVGIDPFTEDEAEKNLIRDFLVAYGTKLMRKKDSRYWISKIEDQVKRNMSNNEVTIITDVRYENEIDWIQEELDGYCIHLTRRSSDREKILPANQDEQINDPILWSKSDAQLPWATIDDEEVFRFIVADELNSVMPDKATQLL